MVDSFYILSLDEIHSPNLTQLLDFDKKSIFSKTKHWHFGLSGVIMPASELPELNLRILKIQSKYYPLAKRPALHYHSILQNKDLYSDLEKNRRKKASLINSICSMIDNTEFQYIASFIDKEELIKKYGTFDSSGRIKDIRKIRGNIYPKSTIVNYDLYALSLRYILKEFYDFLSRKKNTARGIVIAEGIGEKEDGQLRKTFFNLLYRGISTVGFKELRQTILDLLIVYKTQNHAGTQLADLLLYPTFDANVLNHTPRLDHFISYDKLIKPKLYKNDSIKTFP